MSMFLTGGTIASSIKQSISKSGPTWLAVAYWGRGAAKHLGLDKRNKNVRILCDVWSLSCNPDELDWLLECGFEIGSIDGFHGKVYLTDDRMFVGSANASTNGLGREGDDAPLELEAVFTVDDKEEIDLAEEWFERLWDDAQEVKSDVVKKVRALWTLRAKSSLYAALAQDPLRFARQRIFFAVFEDYPKSDVDYKDAWARVKDRYSAAEIKRFAYDGDSPPIYVNRSKLPLATGDYIINYWVKLGRDRRVEHLHATGGVWRVRGEEWADPMDPASAKIIYAERLNSIAGMNASGEYRKVGKLFREYFQKRKSPFRDELLPFNAWPAAHGSLFQRIKEMQTAKAKK